MNEEERLLVAIAADPEDDAPRLAYAEYFRASDPERATFIEKQIEKTRSRRATRSFAPSSRPDAKREAEWTRTLAKYATSWTFDRGFVAAISIDPNLFLEYGEWLFVVAPIRKVSFVTPEDDRFPMKELAGSPLLARLDAIGLSKAGWNAPEPTDDDFLALAASPHLQRLLWLSADKKRLPMSVYEAFAAAPLTRKALALRLSHEGYPGEYIGDTGQDDLQGRAIQDWLPMSPEGAELEKKYGYQPWLHGKDNFCEALDAAYYVANGILPVKPAGS
jgi:uncharacterized protein (TIGR02996 family)